MLYWLKRCNTLVACNSLCNTPCGIPKAFSIDCFLSLFLFPFLTIKFTSVLDNHFSIADENIHSGTAIAKRGAKRIVFIATRIMNQNILSSNRKLFVTFTATWCRECEAMVSLFEQISEQLNLEKQFVKLDWEFNKSKAKELKIYGIPTIVVVEKGKVIDKISGVVSRKQAQHFFKKNTI